MTSVVDTTVKWYTSDQAGLPTLSGTAGSLLTLLDLLVNGHSAKAVTSLVVSGGVATLTFSGTHPALVGQVIEVSGSSITALNGEQKVTAVGANTVSFATAAANGTATGTMSFKLAGAGWAWQFTGTNLGVLRSASPERHGQSLRIDDTNAQAARVVAYESMTDVNTGTNPFPTSAQQSGGGYWWKSGAANSSAVKWVLVADHRAFYLWSAPYSYGAFVQGVVRGFGDPVPLDPSGDIHSTFLGYSTATGANSEVSSSGSLSCSATTGTTGLVVARTKAADVVSQLLTPRAFIGNSGTSVVSGLAGAFGSVGAAVDGKLRPSPRFVPMTTALTPPPRAVLPGIQSIAQSDVFGLIATGDTVDGADDLVGRTLMAVAIAGSGSTNQAPSSSIVGAALFDITGPWR